MNFGVFLVLSILHQALTRDADMRIPEASGSGAGLSTAAENTSQSSDAGLYAENTSQFNIPISTSFSSKNGLNNTNNVLSNFTATYSSTEYAATTSILDSEIFPLVYIIYVVAGFIFLIIVFVLLCCCEFGWPEHLGYSLLKNTKEDKVAGPAKQTDEDGKTVNDFPKQ